MAQLERCFVIVAICHLVQFVQCDDIFSAETERLRNTPPELSSVGADATQAQARFLPFSASFSLSAGGNTAQTFSIAGTPDGIGLSQSASHGDGSPASGNPGSFSASQSSSIAAGLNGLSASDSNAFAVNHPLYGTTSQANGNSFSLGQAAASSHGDVVNGQAISGAQSSVGATHTQASSSSGAQSLNQRPSWTNAQPNYASGNNGNYYHNSRGTPSLTITVSDDSSRHGIRPSNGWYEVPDSSSRDSWRQPELCKYYNGWYRDPRCRGPRVTISKPGRNPGNQRPYFEHGRDPRKQQQFQQSGGLQISSAAAGTSAQSGPGGLAIGQSSSQSSLGNRQPTTTVNNVQASGNAQAQAHGAAGSIHHSNQNRPNNLQANLSSGSISVNSRPGGFAQGSSHGSSSGGSSTSQVNGSASNGGSSHGSASAGSVIFPGSSSESQSIPKEWIRSAKKGRSKDDDDDPLEEIVSDFADTVYEIFDF